MALVPDQPSGKSVAEEMAFAFMPPVERLGVEEIQPMKRFGDGGESPLDDEMVVSVHQAKDVTPEVEAPERIAQLTEEPASILVVANDGAGVDPARDKVKDALVR